MKDEATSEFESFLKEAKEIMRIKKHPDQVNYEDIINKIEGLPSVIANAMYASFLKGRASKEIRLPSFENLFIAVNKAKKAESEAKYLYHWLLKKIKALNECEGEK